MIKKLLKGAKGYEKQSVLTVILVLLETALEVVLPLLMSTILNTMQLYSQPEVLAERLIYLDWSAFKIVTLDSVWISLRRYLPTPLSLTAFL